MDIHQSVDNAHGGATDADFPTSMIQFNPFIPTTVNHDTLNVFIRESYRSYYGHIREAFALDYRMITLTGTSGIGLSCFYSYFFDRFRAKKKERLRLSQLHSTRNGNSFPAWSSHLVP